MVVLFWTESNRLSHEKYSFLIKDTSITSNRTDIRKKWWSKGNLNYYYLFWTERNFFFYVKKRKRGRKFTENFWTEERCQDAEEDKPGDIRNKGPVGETKNWWTASITFVFTSRMKRGELVLHALESGEQSQVWALRRSTLP